MKTKLFLCAVTAVCLSLGSAALADEMKDVTLVEINPTSITVQNGKDTWIIKQGSGTSTTVTGTMKVGALVTVNYATPDAQKKEAPMGGTPTPAGR